MIGPSLEQCIAPAQSRIAKLFYGHDLPIFDASAVKIIEPDHGVVYESPSLQRDGSTATLKLSREGAQRWDEKLSRPCGSVDITPTELYATTGAAILEITVAARNSLNGNEDVRERVMKTYKMLEKGDKLEAMAAQIGEHTRVPVKQILAAFDFDELLRINHLRYGIGIALRALELRPKQIEVFQGLCQGEAVHMLNRYYDSAARFLLSEACSEDDATRMIGEVYSLDPPVLEFAASSPMNVSYLLNK